LNKLYALTGVIDTLAHNGRLVADGTAGMGSGESCCARLWHIS